MGRYLPRSLLGQVMLAVTLTLFIVQGVQAVLAYNIEKDRTETALVNTLGLRLVASQRLRDGDAGNFVVRIDPRGPRDRVRDGDRSERGGRGSRRFSGTDFTRADSFEMLPADRRLPDLEARLAQTLRDNGREFSEVRLVARPVSADPVAERFLQRLARRRGWQEADLPDRIAVAGVTDGERWDIVRAPIRGPHEHFGPFLPMARAALLTALLCFVLWLVLRRITGPLAQLTQRTERFSQKPEASAPMEPKGPQDVRRLIAAHNAMEARIGAMLDEKDVMLGAIGHDLKTPLAALRVRVENVENDTARGRMVDSIEDITTTLDEILALARVGKSGEPAERTDLAALAASVVEEFEDMGEVVEVETERVVAPVHLTWLKRGLRNLVSNALRYGGSAKLTVFAQGNEAVLRVVDSGPGIPEDRIAEMLEPFKRGEASRNRETGGAGLGLTLARAVADRHDGVLELSNRPEGGLSAELRLPL